MLQEYATVTPALEREENYLTKNCRGFQMAVMLIYMHIIVQGKWENQHEMLQEYATVTPTLEKEENYLTKNCRGFQMAVALIYMHIKVLDKWNYQL